MPSETDTDEQGLQVTAFNHFLDISCLFWIVCTLPEGCTLEYSCTLPKGAAEKSPAVWTHCLLSLKSSTEKKHSHSCLSWKKELLVATFQIRLVQTTWCSHIPLNFRNKQLGFYQQCNESSRAETQAGICKERSSTCSFNSLCSGQRTQWPIQLVTAVRSDLSQMGYIPPSISTQLCTTY